MKCSGPSVAQRARSYVVVGACVLVLLTGQGCRESSKPAAGITITLIHQLWSDKGSQQWMNETLKAFTARSGIRVEVLPAPEPAVEQLATWRNLLTGRASVPDVYGIDVIWPEILADEFVDLRT